ncbi:membrane AbrB-like protein [Virgibacillus natechei]|uniref:Membrane AbrB-like protein n=1 Tax=Virgibacillus natechei TaxID=1216297 RepID=A0ABS4IJP5_9BACI|nr:AbrB family transcriptional regulator [Virgibacillus natechei]MBP1971142.1 membrane AbrB-like protein [Virgibacillus natechei]UZD12173.1 AbrB family transcriptional regulator [Virgibacillus natechei]
MTFRQIPRLIETGLVAFLGGFLFYLANFPLPWVLGAVTFIMLWQGITNREALIPISIRNTGFVILGIYFGLYFTAETFQTILPYFIPYILFTCVLILLSILLGVLVSRWVNVDKVTSVFSIIPGGLTEMAIASRDMNANAGLVVIFQTIRLITVLFTVPAFMMFVFIEGGQQASNQMVTEAANVELWNYLWFIIPIVGALYIRHKIPAGIIIGALLLTAILNVSPAELGVVPPVLMNAAQIVVGASLGKNILFRDLKLGGKYCFIYFGLAIILIITSFGLAILLANVTSLDYPTAILSLAPGGLIEMVLTAYTVGGDPAIVSALQLMRILVIVIGVPPFLKWWFNRKREGKEVS